MRFQPIKTKSTSIKSILIQSLSIMVLLLFIVCISIAAGGNKQRQKEYLEDALRRDITYCYATTGAYPDSLTWKINTIENKYGLVYNKNQFYIDYKVIGKNIYPKVTILER